jgi:hypothetical protein
VLLDESKEVNSSVLNRSSLVRLRCGAQVPFARGSRDLVEPLGELLRGVLVGERRDDHAVTAILNN